MIITYLEFELPMEIFREIIEGCGELSKSCALRSKEYEYQQYAGMHDNELSCIIYKLIKYINNKDYGDIDMEKQEEFYNNLHIAEEYDDRVRFLHYIKFKGVEHYGCYKSS